jgi:hypothetical protein
VLLFEKKAITTFGGSFLGTLCQGNLTAVEI